jgi:hypothetical protein
MNLANDRNDRNDRNDKPNITDLKYNTTKALRKQYAE